MLPYIHSLYDATLKAFEYQYFLDLTPFFQKARQALPSPR